jgi:hypothetical protein
MKKLIAATVILLLVFQGWIKLNAQSTMVLVESAGNCGLSTDCSANTVCLDIVLIPGISAQLLSYNLWVNYENSGLNYTSDNACITQNGNDNNLDFIGHYRVAGVSGMANVTIGIPVAIHTICFTYTSVTDIDGDMITVGGTLFGAALSTITFTNPPFNEPNLPEFPLVFNADNITCISLLPVKWLSFDVNKQGETSVLDWRTGEEFNNMGFEVQRSPDGRNFEKIGWLDAKATPRELNSYQFLDVNPYKGINYYRLNQVDFDGKFSFSPVKSVLFSDEGFNVRTWPNPVSNRLFIEISNDEKEKGEIKLINSTGEVVIRQLFEYSEMNAQLDINPILPGFYTLIVESPHHSHLEKIIIVK